MTSPDVNHAHNDLDHHQLSPGTLIELFPNRNEKEQTSSIYKEARVRLLLLEANLKDLVIVFTYWINAATWLRRKGEELDEDSWKDIYDFATDISGFLYRETRAALDIHRQLQLANFQAQLSSIQMNDEAAKTIQERSSQLLSSCRQHHISKAELEAEHRMYVVGWMMRPMHRPFDEGQSILINAHETMMRATEQQKAAEVCLSKLRHVAVLIKNHPKLVSATPESC